jgi:hypothetical protein
MVPPDATRLPEDTGVTARRHGEERWNSVVGSHSDVPYLGHGTRRVPLRPWEGLRPPLLCRAHCPAVYIIPSFRLHDGHRH